ncbi:MAG TPA: hypothetical protein VGB51_08120 [Actinomycetota bacterium]
MNARRSFSTLAAGLIVLLVAAAAPPGVAYPRPGRTERVNLGLGGAEANGVTFESDLSQDGRYVAFGSQASNLVAGDTNGVEDIFVYDRATVATERVSVSSAGDEGDGTSFHAGLTPDGRFVTFTSHARNLVPGDTNGVTDVFVHDRATGTTERVSVATSGAQTERRAFDPAISADGRFVAFISGSVTLDPPDTNGGCDTAAEGSSQGCDVFVHDRATGVTERVSEGPNGEQGGGPSGWNLDISADGRYVSFYSFAPNFVTSVPGDRNSYSDIFVKDRLTGNIERVSVASDGTEANAGSTESAMSDDGRFVAFTSIAPNLTPTESDPLWNDVYVHDRLTGETERVSVSSSGEEGNGNSGVGDISGDGRYVLFQSDATDLVPGDTNGARDVFVHDRLTRTTDRITVAGDGAEGDGDSFPSSITPDGRLIGFGSQASNLVTGDQNGWSDPFVRDRGPALGVGALDVAASGADLQVSGWATFAGRVHGVNDPATDGGAGARELGYEITGAELIERPELGDLLLRLSLDRLPGVRGRSRVPGIGGPATIYLLSFRVGSVSYEVGVSRTATGTSATLTRCEAACEAPVALAHGLGTTGEEVLASVPRSALGSVGPLVLADVRAAAGVNVDGVLDPLADHVNLGSITTAPASLVLGVAPAGTPEDQVAFDTAAALTDGSFSGTLDVSGLSGDVEVWARACLGGECVARSTALSL